MRDGLVWLIGLFWLAGVAAGFLAWDRYGDVPGAIGAEKASLPASNRWQLLVFLHPRCPCSRTAIDELAEAVSRTPELAVRVLFVRPDGVGDGWEKGANWDAAATVPGVEIVCDSDGAEARRVGAETSGHAVLFNPAGQVVFRGGLTRGRGQGGESRGRRAILDWVQLGQGAASAPVFGCALRNTVE